MIGIMATVVCLLEFRLSRIFNLKGLPDLNYVREVDFDVLKGCFRRSSVTPAFLTSFNCRSKCGHL